MLLYAAGETITNFVGTIRTLQLNGDYLWIVAGFYGITMLVALLVTWLSMRKHSPLTYLRGVNE